MMEWSDTDLMVRDAVQEFIDKEVRPHIDALESGEVPPYPIIRKLFAQFGLDTLAAEQVTLHRGDVLVRQGEPSEALFFVLSGRFTVHIDGEAEPIAEIAQGQPIAMPAAPESPDQEESGAALLLWLAVGLAIVTLGLVVLRWARTQVDAAADRGAETGAESESTLAFGEPDTAEAYMSAGRSTDSYASESYESRSYGSQSYASQSYAWEDDASEDCASEGWASAAEQHVDDQLAQQHEPAWWEVLGVSRYAEMGEIVASYRVRVRRAPGSCRAPRSWPCCSRS